MFPDSDTIKWLNETFPDTSLVLEKLAEEAAEVIQAKSKIIHFGLKDTYNNNADRPDQTNQEKLETEIAHFQAVVDILIAKKIVRYHKMQSMKPAKWEKMKKWNDYNGTKGDI